MANIDIPDGLLEPHELKQLQDAVYGAVGEKKRTGRMTLERFINIIKSVCSWFWDKIYDFVTRIWDGLTSLF